MILSILSLFQQSAAAFLLFAATATNIAADWMVLTPDHVISLSGHIPVVELADEQTASIGTEIEPNFKPSSPLIGNWQNVDVYYPMSIVIDLKAKHHVRRIAYYDGVGSANFRVDARDGDSWRHLFDDSLERYVEWTLRDFDVNTRYQRLTFKTPAAQVGELLVDAQPLEPVVSTTKQAPHDAAC